MSRRGVQNFRSKISLTHHQPPVAAHEMKVLIMLAFGVSSSLAFRSVFATGTYSTFVPAEPSFADEEDSFLSLIIA